MFGGAFGGLQEMEVPETPPVEEPVAEPQSEETPPTEVAEILQTRNQLLMKSFLPKRLKPHLKQLQN